MELLWDSWSGQWCLHKLLEMFDNEEINFSVVLKSSFSGKLAGYFGFNLVME